MFHVNSLLKELKIYESLILSGYFSGLPCLGTNLFVVDEALLLQYLADLLNGLPDHLLVPRPDAD